MVFAILRYGLLRFSRVRRVVGALALSIAAFGLGFAPASAAEPLRVKMAAQADNPFSALVGKRRRSNDERLQTGNVERYVLASDDRVFLLEESSASARVQFLCSPDDPRFECVVDPVGPAPEIYQLTTTRGPRGDVIYKTSEGDTLLRIAVYGGATVFWPGEPSGVAASKSFGDDHKLALVFEDREVATRRAQGAAAHVSAMTGSPLYFDISQAPTAPGANASVLADAVLTAAKGITKVADDPIGARVIAGSIKRVSFVAAPEPFVVLNGAVLEVGIVLNRNIDGRPSSAAVAKYLENTL